MVNYLVFFQICTCTMQLNLIDNMCHHYKSNCWVHFCYNPHCNWHSNAHLQILDIRYMTQRSKISPQNINDIWRMVYMIRANIKWYFFFMNYELITSILLCLLFVKWIVWRHYALLRSNIKYHIILWFIAIKISSEYLSFYVQIVYNRYFCLLRDRDPFGDRDTQKQKYHTRLHKNKNITDILTQKP